MTKGLGADQPYWDALAAGHLALPRCSACEKWSWPAPFRCGDCGSTDFHWSRVEMTGLIYTWTRVSHPFAGMEDMKMPFVSVLVELPQAGGIRLLGILDNDAPNPSIGASVNGHIGKTTSLGHEVPALKWTMTS